MNLSIMRFLCEIPSLKIVGFEVGLLADTVFDVSHDVARFGLHRG